MADYLKIPEVARRLDVSEKTARRYVKDGTLPSVFVGGAYRVSEEDLGDYLEGAKVQPGKAPAPLQLQLVEEHDGADSELAAKLQQQLDAQLRVLRERQSEARSDEDLHEAAKDFQHWWLSSFDWLATFGRMHPEYLGPRLEEVVNRVGLAVNEELPRGAVNPRNVPEMSEVLRGWASVRSQEADV